MAIQDFTAGQVLTAAQMDNLQANDYNQTVSTKTANYTLVAADKGTRVVMNAAGATTITVNDSLFTAGDTLQLQNIGAGVTTLTAGTATVSSAGPLAIPQYGSGTLFFNSAGVAIYFPSAVNVSSAVVQVKSTTKDDTFSASVAAGANTAITGLSVSITPTSASNKILVLCNVNGSVDPEQNMNMILFRDATAIGVGASTGSRQAITSALGAANTGQTLPSTTAVFLDSPATTSAVTYSANVSHGSGTTRTLYVNRTVDDTNNSEFPRSVSTITVIEVTP